LTRALVLSRTSVLSSEHFALDAVHGLGAPEESEPVDLSVAATIRAHVEHVLASSGGNKTQAARILKISRQRLDRILNREDGEDIVAERTSGRSES
jgi:DNA-binding NtrC family response regulator